MTINIKNNKKREALSQKYWQKYLFSENYPRSTCDKNCRHLHEIAGPKTNDGFPINWKVVQVEKNVEKPLSSILPKMFWRNKGNHFLKQNNKKVCFQFLGRLPFPKLREYFIKWTFLLLNFLGKFTIPKNRIFHKIHFLAFHHISKL